MTTDELRGELRTEAIAARQVRWGLTLAAVAFATAYGVTTFGLGRRDPIYLLLAAGAVAAAATHLVVRERFRVPECLQRLTAKTPREFGLRSMTERLWPQVRVSHGRGLAALDRRKWSRDEIDRMTLDAAVVLVTRAGRRDWDRFFRRWAWGLGVLLGLIAMACYQHVPSDTTHQIESRSGSM
jgi:hypothetical protein